MAFEKTYLHASLIQVGSMYKPNLHVSQALNYFFIIAILI